MTELKVVNLGLPKSGTTTLAEALRQAGFSVADWRIRAGQTKNRKITHAFVGKLLYEGFYSSGNPLALMPEFDGFTEISVVRNGLNLWPQTDWALISAIQDHYPDVRFLLTHRDSVKLSDSMARWSNLGTRRLPENSIPGLPEGYGSTDVDRIRWIEGHYAFCRKVFAGAKNFLEYDVEDPDAPFKIGKFLDRDLPWWGVANRNDNNPSNGSST